MSVRSRRLSSRRRLAIRRRRPSSRGSRRVLLSAAALAGVLAFGCQAFSSDFAEFGGERVRGARDRAAQQDTMLELRLDGLLAAAMQAHEIDCWVIVSRSGDDDPMVAHLTVRATRIAGVGGLLLCERAGLVERVGFGRGLGANRHLYDIVETTDEQQLMMLLADRLRAADPARIAIDKSGGLGIADGLSGSLEALLRASLGDLVERVVSSTPLVETFLSAQLDDEAPLFTESARLTVALLEEALSDRVVFAAGTSLDDLTWAVRERAAALNLELAFPPRTIVFRSGTDLGADQRMELDLRLQPGDLFFLSAGVRYLGYANRYGRWAYLMRDGERAAPAWVDEALAGLARRVEQAAGAVRSGLDGGEATAVVAALGADGGAFNISRLSRLMEGDVEPLALFPTSFSWAPEFRLPQGAGIGISVRISTDAGDATTISLVAMETAIVGTAGATLVLPPQRAAILID